MLRGGFFAIKAPVFAHPFVAIQAITTVIIAASFGAGFYSAHKSGFMHIEAGLMGQASNLFSYFTGLSGFLFGFFIFNGLGGYNTIKNNYLGGFWGGAQNLMVLVPTFFPEPEHAELRETIIRWTMASFTLMCGLVTDGLSYEKLMDLLEKRNLLTIDETQMMNGYHGNPNVPLMWAMMSLKAQIYKYDLPGPHHKGVALEKTLLAMRGSIGGVLTACSTFGQTPLPLVHLMSALVKMQLFFLALNEGLVMASICVDESEGKIPQLMMCGLMLIVTPIIFQGLLEFVIMVNNPFGEDWVDYPASLYYVQLRDEIMLYNDAGTAALDLGTVNKWLQK